MTRAFMKRIKCLGLVIVVMLAVHGVNILLGGGLAYFGIIPGSTAHWWHIFTAPFIHGDWVHLSNNLLALMVFGSLCLTRSVSFFVLSSLFIIAMTGGLVWLFGRQAMHIGASGWVFGLWSLSIAIAWFDRRIGNILIACLVLFFYGGMIYGVLPSDPKISFEAHFFGALSGVLWAFIIATYFKRSGSFFRS